MFAQVSIQVDNINDGRVMVDGYNIAPALRGWQLHHIVGRMPELVLQVPTGVIDFSGKTKVIMSERVAELLESMGWTPPGSVSCDEVHTTTPMPVPQETVDDMSDAFWSHAITPLLVPQETDPSTNWAGASAGPAPECTCPQMDVSVHPLRPEALPGRDPNCPIHGWK